MGSFSIISLNMFSAPFSFLSFWDSHYVYAGTLRLCPFFFYFSFYFSDWIISLDLFPSSLILLSVVSNVLLNPSVKCSYSHCIFPLQNLYLVVYNFCFCVEDLYSLTYVILYFIVKAQLPLLFKNILIIAALKLWLLNPTTGTLREFLFPNFFVWIGVPISCFFVHLIISFQVDILDNILWQVWILDPTLYPLKVILLFFICLVNWL